MDQQNGRGTVVVGVDGSTDSRRALEEALRGAARTGRQVRAIAVYEPPETWSAWGYGPASAIPVPSRTELELAETEAARGFVSEVRAGLADELSPVPEVDLEVLPGQPSHVLPEAARGAAELVVGHRGRGAAASMMLGSVGWACVLHAPCPVTVVPAEPATQPA